MIDFEKLFLSSLDEKNNKLKVEKYNDLIFQLCEVIDPICAQYDSINKMINNTQGVTEEGKKLLFGSMMTNSLSDKDFEKLLNIRNAISAIYDKKYNQDAVSSGDTKNVTVID